VSFAGVVTTRGHGSLSLMPCLRPGFAAFVSAWRSFKIQ
jgi:hypothetical protein